MKNLIYLAQTLLLFIATLTTANAQVIGPGDPEDDCLSIPYFASFETDFDGWTNATWEDINWLRVMAANPSFYIGPSTAAHGSDFVLVQPAQVEPGQIAILNGPCFTPPSQEVSISFSYHMYYPDYLGNQGNSGNLKLQARYNGGHNWVTLWEKTGAQNRSWRNATVNVDAPFDLEEVEFRFYAKNGSNWIAVDKVNVSCAVPETPQFDISINLCETVLTIVDIQDDLTYTWEAINQPPGVSFSQDPSLTAFLGFFGGPQLSTEVEICLTAANDCGENTFCTIVPLECLYIGDGLVGSDPIDVPHTQKVQATVSPNPASTSLTFEMKVQEPLSLSIHIYSLDGRLVKSFAEESFEDGYFKKNWDIDQSLDNGLYVVHFNTNQGSFQEKIMIVK